MNLEKTFSENGKISNKFTYVNGISNDKKFFIFTPIFYI